MWWEYAIIFIALGISIYYLIRRFRKKVKSPECESDCHDCPYKGEGGGC
jgi:hypothetical protein